MVEASVATDADPRDRRRSNSSEWFPLGHSRGLVKASFVVKGYQGSEGGVSALVLCLMQRARVKAGAVRIGVTISADDAATGSR
jgi:hypothetical protein